jgi:hypothetical protein
LVELFVVVVARSRYCSFSIVIMASWGFFIFYFVGGVVDWGFLFIDFHKLNPTFHFVFILAH